MYSSPSPLFSLEPFLPRGRIPQLTRSLLQVQGYPRFLLHSWVVRASAGKGNGGGAWQFGTHIAAATPTTKGRGTNPIPCLPSPSLPIL